MTRPGSRSSLLVLLPALLLLVPAGLAAQQILTAQEFFNTVAATYASIEDYVADMIWRDERGTMRGALTYKRPNMVRIDFTQPENQLLVSNGRRLLIYVPAHNVRLTQTLRPGEAGTAPGGLATAEGLALMRRNYSIAYLEGPEPVPLNEGSSTFVTKLRLDRRQASEGFRRLVLSVDDEGFIRRIEGTKADWEEVVMELSNIRINQRVSTQVFEEEGESSASIEENFLYDPEG